MLHAIIDSPLGPLTLSGDRNAIVSLTFGSEARTHVPDELAAAARQLGEYFDGRRQMFELPLRRVWRALMQIPYETTTTYGRLADQIKRETGGPVGPRAVASAVARTPVPIIIPCHRVIGSDGSLRGYIGGLERKRALLALEGASIRDHRPRVSGSGRQEPTRRGRRGPMTTTPAPSRRAA